MKHIGRSLATLRHTRTRYDDETVLDEAVIEATYNELKVMITDIYENPYIQSAMHCANYSWLKKKKRNMDI